jgi:hypothetical protein
MEKVTRERALELSKSLAYRLVEASKEYDLPIGDPENFKKKLGSSFFKGFEKLGALEEPIKEEEQVLPLVEELGTVGGISKFEPKKEVPFSLEEEYKGTASAMSIFEFKLGKDEPVQRFSISGKEETTNENFR